MIEAEESFQLDLFAFGFASLEPFDCDAPCVDVDAGNHSRMDATWNVEEEKKLAKLSGKIMKETILSKLSASSIKREKFSRQFAEVSTESSVKTSALFPARK